MFRSAILTHGGSGSNSKDSDGPAAAAKMGMDSIKNGKSALDSVVQAVRYLEEDSRFNAGCGSQFRSDGHTIQLDASCMIGSGNFGAVACVEGVLNPIDLAHGVLLYSPHILIMGKGAHSFAAKHNITINPPSTLEKKIGGKKDGRICCDTVGAVAFDGIEFAAALSSGGIEKAAIGRVGDVPLPGCGLFCGPSGAVACTGDGELIALKILAREVYGWLSKKVHPKEAAQKAMRAFSNSVDVGIIILTKSEFAASARNDMAWSYFVET